MYADLVFPINLGQSFTFAVPEALQPVIQLGQRVVAPFGRRNQQGMVVGFRDSIDAELAEKIRPIERIVDPMPIFTPSLLELLKWMANYYLTPLGKVIQTAIPSDARLKK
ncbi:MAG: primosomal protein N', partial [Candidatus Marinimicrobia bacterium CG_4_9_14_3_um_filter_48_9]